MKIRKLLLILFCISNVINIYSDEQLVIELNRRAFDSIVNDPSNSIYYSDKSIDENISLEYWEEYIFSLYIKSLSYEKLGENEMLLNMLTEADNFLISNNLIFKNSDFYVFYGKTLLKNKENDKLDLLLSVVDIISILDDKALVEFNILKFKSELSQNRTIDVELLEQTLTMSQNLDAPELTSEIYVLYGDLYLGSARNKSQSYYLKASEFGNNYYSSVGLFKLGKLLNSISYIREAYTISELIDNYDLMNEILIDLIHRYKNISDYKNLSLILESQNYIFKRNSDFLLKQNKKIERFGYDKEKLGLELEKSNSNKSLINLILVSMGVAILLLIIMLSIQSYKLRDHNL